MITTYRKVAWNSNVIQKEKKKSNPSKMLGKLMNQVVQQRYLKSINSDLFPSFTTFGFSIILCFIYYKDVNFQIHLKHFFSKLVHTSKIKPFCLFMRGSTSTDQQYHKGECTLPNKESARSF